MWQLVDDARCLGCEESEKAQILVGKCGCFGRGFRGEGRCEFCRIFVIAEPAAEFPHAVKLARSRRLWMMGDDLLGKRGARSRHADDEDRNVAAVACSTMGGEELGSEGGDSGIDACPVAR